MELLLFRSPLVVVNPLQIQRWRLQRLGVVGLFSRRLGDPKIFLNNIGSINGLHSSTLMMPLNIQRKTGSSTLQARSFFQGFFGPPSEVTIKERVVKALGYSDQSRTVLRAHGYVLYIKLADELDYKSFFELCQMEDTFVSWFAVLEVHVWLLSSRLMEDGVNGKIIRDALLKAMWEDNTMKSKKLEGAIASARQAQIQELSGQFNAMLVSYDEGLLGPDRVLAGALWRRFFMSNRPVDQKELLQQIVALEMLVSYVRSQHQMLHRLNKDKMIKGRFKFEAFNKKLLDKLDSQAIVH